MIYSSDSPSSNLQWLSTLDTEEVASNNENAVRRSSIICTIGPKTNNVEMMTKLVEAGMNIVRMNFSHGSHEYHQSVIDNVLEVRKKFPGRALPIALDDKGPEIRSGVTLESKDYPISTGDEMTFTTDDAYAQKSDNKVMYIDYKNITKVLSKGKMIHVDDGVLTFEVLEIVDDKTMKVRACNNGFISSHKGVNLPGTDIDLPALSEKDKADLRFGVKNGVDMIFASFIRTGNDVRQIREVLGEEGKRIKVISKIENQQGVNNFPEILKETDGVMVARGDLGIEIPAPKVFAVQKQLISQCMLSGKACIVATQIFESMIKSPVPTRAEVSDCANAIIDGADAVMLSGETAKGDYPINAVSMMHQTCLVAEKTVAYQPLFNEIRSLAPRPTETAETVAISAVSASYEQSAKAIIVLSTSGTTAHLLSKYKPDCPIFMVTRNANARYSILYRSVIPLVYEQPKASSSAEWQEDVEARLEWGMERAAKMGVLKKGDPVVVIQGWTGGLGHSNTLRILEYK